MPSGLEQWTFITTGQGKPAHTHICGGPLKRGRTPRAAVKRETVTSLLLKRASASRSSGEWSESDYDVLADGVVIGGIMRAAAAPEMPGAVYSPRQLLANAAIAASRVAA